MDASLSADAAEGEVRVAANGSPRRIENAASANRKLKLPAFKHAEPSRPNSPLRMSDEILEFYAFVFCQGGFRQLGMTFEQFLEVVDVVRPGGLRPTYDDMAVWKRA